MQFKLLPKSMILDESSERECFIKEVLSRGGIVRFTNKYTGVTKDVNEWLLDDDGDLKAFRTSDKAATQFVCWEASQYDLSELKE